MITTDMTRPLFALLATIALTFSVHAQTPVPAPAVQQTLKTVEPLDSTTTLSPAQLQNISTLLTGDEPASGLPAAIRDNLKWNIYKQEVKKNWAEYDKKIGTPMVSWAKQNIGRATETVFYPFSGPDFTTVYQLFPDAKRYVMVAMQNAGRPMDLGAHSPLITDQSLDQLIAAWQLYGTHGFFVTSYLDTYYYATRGKIGASTFLAIFLKLQGFDIERVTPITVGANGEVQELPIETKIWHSVRFNAIKNGKAIVLDYLKIDLSNPGLQASPHNFQFVQNMSVNPTLFKAASHLPQNTNFNMIAKAVLDHAPFVVQDETGLNYTTLNNQFKSTLFGKFVIAHHAFQSYQQDLARAFTERQDINPLNFRFGYYKDGSYVMMVAERK